MRSSPRNFLSFELAASYFIMITTSPRKKVGKHSLHPEIYMQLELSSPQRKHIDPSDIDIFNNLKASKGRAATGARRGEEQQEQYILSCPQCSSGKVAAHVRLEHCTELREGLTEIRIEVDEEKAEEDTPPPVSEIEVSTRSSLSNSERRKKHKSKAKKKAPETFLSPSSVMLLIQQQQKKPPPLGRHDYLIDILPEDVLQNLAAATLGPPPPNSTKNEKANHDHHNSQPRRRAFRRSKSIESINVEKSSRDVIMGHATKQRRTSRRRGSLGHVEQDFEPNNRLVVLTSNRAFGHSPPPLVEDCSDSRGLASWGTTSTTLRGSDYDGLSASLPSRGRTIAEV